MAASEKERGFKGDLSRGKLAGMINANDIAGIRTAIAADKIKCEIVLDNISGYTGTGLHDFLLPAGTKQYGSGVEELLQVMGVKFEHDDYRGRMITFGNDPRLYSTSELELNYAFFRQEKPHNYNLIHWAMFLGKEEIALELLELVVNDKKASRSKLELFACFKKDGKKINSPSGSIPPAFSFKISLLMLALAKNQKRIAGLLAEQTQGFASNSRFRMLKTRSSRSEESFPVQVVPPDCQDEMILQACAAAGPKDQDNKLEHAIRTCNVDLVKAVLKQFPQPALRHKRLPISRMKSKCIMKAIETGNREIVRALLDWCCTSIVKDNKHSAVVSLSKLKQALVEKVNRSNNNPLEQEILTELEKMTGDQLNLSSPEAIERLCDFVTPPAYQPTRQKGSLAVSANQALLQQKPQQQAQYRSPTTAQPPQPAATTAAAATVATTTTATTTTASAANSGDNTYAAASSAFRAAPADGELPPAYGNSWQQQQSKFTASPEHQSEQHAEQASAEPDRAALQPSAATTTSGAQQASPRPEFDTTGSTRSQAALSSERTSAPTQSELVGKERDKAKKKKKTKQRRREAVAMPS